MKGAILYKTNLGHEQWFYKRRSAVSRKAGTEEEERIADRYLKTIKEILKRKRYDIVFPKLNKK